MQAVLTRDQEQGSRVSAHVADLAELALRPHSGRVPGRVEITIPWGLRAFGLDSELTWDYRYEWFPDQGKRVWKIFPSVHADKLSCSGETTYYRTDVGGTVQSAIVTVSVSVPGFSEDLERRILDRLGVQAREDCREISRLAALIASGGDEQLTIGTEEHAKTGVDLQSDQSRTTAELQRQLRAQAIEGDRHGAGQPVIWEALSAVASLVPFWIGTVGAGTATGYFIGHSVQAWLSPVIFVGIVPILFFFGVSTFSTSRKNMFGLFLALFCLSFWVGVENF
jgi:hypothetical protein